MNRIICAIFGHKFRVIKEFYPGCERVRCPRCDRDYVRGEGLPTIEWSFQAYQMFKFHGKI